MMDKESIDIMVAQANDGMKKFLPDENDRRKILNDGYVDVDLAATIDRQDPRVQAMLFQMYEGFRAKLAIVPTHVTYTIHDDTHITFRFHVVREDTGNNDALKKAIVKLECAREGRHAELTKEEFLSIAALSIGGLANDKGTWHGKPYVVLPDTSNA